MPEPHLRAADADRAAVAGVLGQHMAAGRLTVEEYDERLTRTYAAKTYGELDELTADLPATVPAPRTAPPQPAVTRPTGIQAHAGGWHSDPHAWRSWMATAMIVLTVWAVTSLANGEFLYFWPAWVIGPWGAFLLVQALADRRDDDREKRRQLG